MKKTTILTVIMVGILILTAWRWNSSKNEQSTTGISDKTTTMAPALELATGTIRLEGTSQAVDKQMAEELLPYWQLLDELNTSESTASLETTTVLENIKGIMTTEQVEDIENMQLTQSGVATVIQDTGTTNISDSTTSNISNIVQVSIGEIPQGGQPQDSSGMITSRGEVGSSNGSQQSALSSQTSSSIETTSRIEEVIKLLESKIK